MLIVIEKIQIHDNMIEIKETKSFLYLYFQYNPKYVRVIKTLPQRYYNPTSHSWRVPTIYKKDLYSLLSSNNIQYSVLSSGRLMNSKGTGCSILSSTTVPYTQSCCHCYHDNLPEGIKLYEYQIEAINKYLQNKSIILNFDIGAGKTITAILSAIYSKYSPPYLVITRAALIPEFKSELLKYMPSHKNDFVVISYEKYRNKPNDFQKYDIVIMDEVTKFKNYKSKLNSALQSMHHKSFIFLTGLLLENNLQELYAILSVFNKSLFYNFWDFKNMSNIYCGIHKPITAFY